MYVVPLDIQTDKCGSETRHGETFEFAHVVFSSSRHCYFADDSIGVVSKIAMPVILFTFWQVARTCREVEGKGSGQGRQACHNYVHNEALIAALFFGRPELFNYGPSSPVRLQTTDQTTFWLPPLFDYRV